MFEDSLLAKVLQKKMYYTAQRHGVISDNIAKISTPLARTKDLVPFAIVLDRSMMQPIQLKITKKDHIAQQEHISPYSVVNVKDGTEEKLNGNNISLSNESMKLNHNTLEHNKVISIYSKMLSMFNMAIGGSR